MCCWTGGRCGWTGRMEVWKGVVWVVGRCVDGWMVGLAKEEVWEEREQDVDATDGATEQPEGMEM